MAVGFRMLPVVFSTATFSHNSHAGRRHLQEYAYFRTMKSRDRQRDWGKRGVIQADCSTIQRFHLYHLYVAMRESEMGGK